MQIKRIVNANLLKARLERQEKLDESSAELLKKLVKQPQIATTAKSLDKKPTVELIRPNKVIAANTPAPNPPPAKLQVTAPKPVNQIPAKEVTKDLPKPAEDIPVKEHSKDVPKPVENAPAKEPEDLHKPAEHVPAKESEDFTKPAENVPAKVPKDLPKPVAKVPTKTGTTDEESDNRFLMIPNRALDEELKQRKPVTVPKPMAAQPVLVDKDEPEQEREVNTSNREVKAELPRKTPTKKSPARKSSRKKKKLLLF